MRVERREPFFRRQGGEVREGGEGGGQGVGARVVGPREVRAELVVEEANEALPMGDCGRLWLPMGGVDFQ